MTAPTWRAVHLYYYDNAGREDLILDAVGPLLERLDGVAQRAYFLRHWRRGPHVRIPVLADPGTFTTSVEPAVRDTVGDFLRRRPSSAQLPPEDVLLPAHQRAAEAELEQGPLRPLVPDNSIRFEEHDRRLHVLDSDAGMDLLADFYASTNDLALTTLARIRGGLNREILSIALMVAIAHRLCGDPRGIEFGFVSFRSHAEGFLHRLPSPESARESFDRQYHANSTTLRKLVTTVLDGLEGRGTELPDVTEWLGVMCAFLAEGDRLLRTGQLTLEMPAAQGVAPTRVSPMHQLMLENDALGQLLTGAEFKRYRFVLNYTYLHLARLGVEGYARSRLCHFVANAVEEILGLNAFEIITQYAAKFPNHPTRTPTPAIPGPNE